MINLPHYKILSNKEECELALRIKNGDRAARNLLVLSNVPFAIKYAKSFSGYGLEQDDLISEGIIGLIMAAKGFKAEKGFRFITYARFWIHNEIQRAAEKGKNKAECYIDSDEILSFLADSPNESVEEECVNNVMAQSLHAAVNALSQRESDIIFHHYGLGNAEAQSFNQIAKDYGVSKARIHQIESKALKDLKVILENG